MRGKQETQRWYSQLSGSESTFHAFVPYPMSDFHESIPLELAGQVAEAERCFEAAMREFGRPLLVSLLEGRASSRIEGYEVNILPHLKEMSRAKATRYSLTSLIQNNADLVRAVMASGKEELTPNLLHEWHELLFEDIDFNRRDWIGNIRKGQAWIGGLSPLYAVFVPPPADRCSDLLDDLCLFEGRKVFSPVVASFVNYAQFETIHPYSDGNGRLGRALIQYSLVSRGMTTGGLLSTTMEAMYHEHIGLLVAWRKGNTQKFFAYLLDILNQASDSILELNRILDEIDKNIVNQAKGKTVIRLAGALSGRLTIDVPTAANLLGMSRPAASRAIAKLEQAGILSPVDPDRQRGRSWFVVEAIEAVSNWETAGRVRYC